RRKHGLRSLSVPFALHTGPELRSDRQQRCGSSSFARNRARVVPPWSDSGSGLCLHRVPQLCGQGECCRAGRLLTVLSGQARRGKIDLPTAVEFLKFSLDVVISDIKLGLARKAAARGTRARNGL